MSKELEHAVCDRCMGFTLVDHLHACVNCGDKICNKCVIVTMGSKRYCGKCAREKNIK